MELILIMKNYLKIQNIIIISKNYYNAKTETKNDNRGIKLIKEVLLTMYNKLGAIINKRDNEQLHSFLIILDK